MEKLIASNIYDSCSGTRGGAFCTAHIKWWAFLFKLNRRKCCYILRNMNNKKHYKDKSEKYTTSCTKE